MTNSKVTDKNNYYFELEVYNPKGKMIAKTVGCNLSKKEVEELRVNCDKPKSDDTPKKAYKNGWNDGFQIGYRQREKEYIGGSKVLEEIKKKFEKDFACMKFNEQYWEWFLPYLTDELQEFAKWLYAPDSEYDYKGLIEKFRKETAGKKGQDE